MQKINFLKGIHIEEKIADLYIFMMLTIYPLYISNYFIGGNAMKQMIFILITFLCAFVIVYRNIRGKSNIVKEVSRIDTLVIVLVIIMALTRIIRGLNTFESTTELATVCAYGLGYFIVADYGKGRLEHLQMFLYSSAMVCVLLIPSIIMKIWGIGYFKEGEHLVSYFLLVFTVVIPMYLQEKKRDKKVFYFIMFILMTILLLLSNDKRVFIIVPFLVAICIISLRSSLHTFKELLKLVFVMLIIVKAFALIVHYTAFEPLLTGIVYEVTNSIFFDIALVTAGILYCLFLDNTHDYNEQEMKKQYPKVAEITMNIVEVALFLSVIGILLISQISKVKPLFGTKWYILWTRYIVGCFNGGSAAYSQMVEKGGILALILLIIILVIGASTLINSLKKNRSKRVFMVLSIVIMVQNFLYPFQAVTTPIYMILLASAFEKGIQAEENDGEQCET